MENLQTINSIIKEFRITSLSRQVKIIQNLIEENNTIDIAVLGQFKSGKSSFVNNFIGRDILPVGVIPVTSVITRIGFGEDEKAIVKFYDSSDKEIELNTISNYVDEARNPGNKKKVLIVDVFLPSFDKFNGIRIVDTPGIGSYYKYNTDITKEWTPEVGISILAISSERPLGESEVNLLKELIQYSPRIYILLTKSDLFTKPQINEIKEYIINSIENEFGRIYPLYEYSISADSHKHRAHIEQEIFQPLVSNIGEEFREIIEHKAKHLKKEVKNYLEIARLAALKTEEEKAKIKAMIIDEKLNLDYLFGDLRLITSNYTGRTREGISLFLAGFRGDIIKKLRLNFDTEFINLKWHLGKLTRNFEEWIGTVLRLELFELSDEKHYKFITNLQNAQKHFSNYLNSFGDRLNKNIEDALGFKFEKMEWEVDLVDIKQPDIRIGRAFDFHFDLLWFLLPMFLFRNIFIRHFKKEITSLVELNLGRLASDYTERINMEIIKIERQATGFIKDNIETIEALLSSKDVRLERIEKHLSILSQ